MAKKINYNARTFVDYKKELNSLIKKYYPNVINDFNDASIGQFFIDINAAVADDLGFYSDRMFQETQIDQAQERKSLLNIARNNGLKIMGKRPSVVEAEWSCILPGTVSEPDWDYAPILKRGTQASGGGQRFELTEDINFKHQFNKNGMSDRSFIPVRGVNGGMVGYKVSKTCIMSSIESKIYKQSISSGDVEPFMEIILPENNVVKINSILLKKGYNTINPTTLQFMDESDNRSDLYERWYEVKNLLDSKKFMGSGEGEIIEGKWKQVTKKFITEYTDNGYCKITFGGGMPEPESGNTTTTTISFSQYLINNMLNNSYLGEIPSADSTLFIYYSVGGGAQSNIGAGAMTNITYMDLIEESGSDSVEKLNVRNSMKVVNTIPSVSGRDELTTEELRYLIKYNNGAQDRCVTITDYLSRVMLMPSEFGSPFKVGVAEENNKVVISLLGLNSSSDGGNLTNDINGLLIDNIKNYLTEYKSINDYVEIRPGKIINLRFEVDITIENNMKQEDVSKEVGLKVLDFMDVNKHKLGDEIFISRLKSLIGMTTGVKNLIDLKVYNMFGGVYSLNHVTQPVINNTMGDGRVEINLSATDGVLYSNNDTMFEIKNPGENIILNTKYSI